MFGARVLTLAVCFLNKTGASRIVEYFGNNAMFLGDDVIS
jgi:hypothetical protein